MKDVLFEMCLRNQVDFRVISLEVDINKNYIYD